ncbi:MAG: hypothetical protein K2J80_05830 [Oscillospiraceae bacterium]|nr:hypothetical protein [Oscillospiraceae bacterium]
MKKFWLCLVISVSLLFSGCTETKVPVNSEKSSAANTSVSVIESDNSSSQTVDSAPPDSSTGQPVESGSIPAEPIVSSSPHPSESGNVPNITPGNADRLVLVGDSRTMHVGNYVFGLEMINNSLVDDATPDGDYILGVGAKGYNWLEDHTSEVEDKLTPGCALVVNMGVNGVPYYHSEIAAWCNTIAEKYKDMGVKVYFMSVNPVNDTLLAKYNYQIRNADVIYFNEAIKGELSNVTYLDTYSLITDDILGDGSGTYDGLHYYENVCRKIVDYTWEAVKGERP